MDAHARSLRFLGEGKELAVPFFQRHYIWEKENWSELLQSFMNASEVPFLGSIIVKEESSKRATIIDGQQRLTTITILAKAIYDSLSEGSKQPNSGIRNGIENYLFYRNNAADNFEDSKIRISHSRTDRAEYNRIIAAEMLPGYGRIDPDTINENSSRVAQCYQYYRTQLQNCGEDKLKQLFNLMFDENRKVFVLIELKQGDINEQKIFDTINRAGVRLNTADIIKNNFYMRLLDAAGTDEENRKKVDDTYKDCWEDIFDQKQGLIHVWDEERVFGNVKHSNLEFLLYCVACIKWGEDGDMFAKLEDVFDRETRGMGFSELLALAKEIKEYALIFKRYVLDFKASLEAEDSNEYFKYREHVRRLMLILQKFGVQMFYPYVIMRLKQVNQDETDPQLADDFSILESFVMRRKLSKRGTHDYTKKCYQIIQNGITSLILSDLGVSDAGLSDLDMKQQLADTKDDAAKMILFWIELYRRDQGNVDVDALEYKFTLEHIMPKKWEANWKDVPILNKGETLAPDSEEGKQFRNAAIQSIGNKTLLTCSLNASLKNAAFLRKVEGDGPNRPGYRKHTLLLLTGDIVDQAGHDPVWDEAHIETRKAELYEKFITLWPSFSNRMASPEEAGPEEDSDPVLENFTEEQLDDAAMLLEAIPLPSPGVRMAGYYSQEELIERVNVQKETVERYIRDGKMIPDHTEQISQCRSVKYFLPETLLRYAQEFGWTLIDDRNRKDMFLEMVRKMTMSYSYKPIFLKGLFQHADENGVLDVWRLTAYFRSFFDARRAAGLMVEKSDSVYQNAQISDEEILRNILTYPFRRFKDIGVVSYDPAGGEIRVDQSVWNTLSHGEKAEIVDICSQKLDEYYAALSE